jgi:hypothetical protein
VRAISTALSASQPYACVRLWGFPYWSVKNGSMASKTLGSTGVVAFEFQLVIRSNCIEIGTYLHIQVNWPRLVFQRILSVRHFEFEAEHICMQNCQQFIPSTQHFERTRVRTDETVILVGRGNCDNAGPVCARRLNKGPPLCAVSRESDGGRPGPGSLQR